MKNKIMNLIEKYRMLIMYGIFGVLTTAVNLFTYYVCARLLSVPVMGSSLIAWIVGVIFAYVTNRIWVFESKTNGKQGIIKELFSFTLGRAASEVMELVILFVFVTCLQCDDMIWKVISNVLVIIFNYFFSKLVVFREKIGAE